MCEDSELNQPPREKGDNGLIVRWLENLSTYFLHIIFKRAKIRKKQRLQ
jgi:hypothetical protein